MAQHALSSLPPDLLATVCSCFPGREPQIRTLAMLVWPGAAPCRNLVVHGVEATGKSSVVRALLDELRHGQGVDVVNYAVVRSAECVTARHLFERATAAVADAVEWEERVGRCETLAALAVELSRLLKYPYQYQDEHEHEHEQGIIGDGVGVGRGKGKGNGNGNRKGRFILVFDGIDRQRDAPPTLLPALARLSEIIPHLTTIFIVTYPSPAFLRLSSTPHLSFPAYTKAQFVAILSLLQPPPALPNTCAQDTADLYARFAAAVHDALAKPASRTLPSLRRACDTLWPRFTAPVAVGNLRARDFTRLLVAARAWLQDESALEPGIVRNVGNARNANKNKDKDKDTAMASHSSQPSQPSQPPQPPPPPPPPQRMKATTPAGSDAELSALLPLTAKLLLVAAYLASHNAAKHDQSLFSTWHHARKRRRGGTAVSHSGAAATPRSVSKKHRKIARKLLGPGAFVLERMVAIFAALRKEYCHKGIDAETARAEAVQGVVDADVAMAIATLASLRLLVRVGAGAGAGDLDRGGRWRVGVGWEVVRGVGRSLGVEVDEWLVE